MKLAIFNPILNHMPLEDMLKTVKSMGVNNIELGVGGYPGKAHADSGVLVKSQSELEILKNLLTKYQISVSALSVHGNALHPNQSVASEFQQDFENACKLAKLLDIDTIITFSGCPGDSDNAIYPNWVVCPWPEDFLRVLDYQWEKLITYWQENGRFAKDHGIKKIALEMHPGFCVYNPETLLRLRAAVGDIIGANFDPSHLIWQGIDIVSAIKALKGAIYHFHAKDTAINAETCKINGVLDTKHYTNELERSWIFRTVGYGSDEKIWKDIISTLQLVGYNGVISIEHEDSLMQPLEGLKKAVEFLDKIIIKEPMPSQINWA